MPNLDLSLGGVLLSLSLLVEAAASTVGFRAFHFDNTFIAGDFEITSACGYKKEGPGSQRTSCEALYPVKVRLGAREDKGQTEDRCLVGLR